MTVSVANPDTGIGAPLTTRLIPASSPAAATAAVAAAATAVAARPRMVSDVVGAGVVMTDMVFLR